MAYSRKRHKRDIEILKCLASGWTSAEIARHLNLSPRTVEARVLHLSAQMKARNRPHLVALAFKVGLLTLTAETS